MRLNRFRRLGRRRDGSLLSALLALAQPMPETPLAEQASDLPTDSPAGRLFRPPIVRA